MDVFSLFALKTERNKIHQTFATMRRCDATFIRLPLVDPNSVGIIPDEQKRILAEINADEHFWKEELDSINGRLSPVRHVIISDKSCWWKEHVLWEGEKQMAAYENDRSKSNCNIH